MNSYISQDEFNAFLSNPTIQQTLSVLKFKHNRVINDFSGIGNCQNITALNFDCTNFSDCSILPSLPLLYSLSLWDCNQLVDISHLSNVRDLTELQISASGVKTLQPLANHPVLERIYLNALKLDSLIPLASCPNLKVVDIQDSSTLNPSELSTSKSLETVLLPSGLVLEGERLSELANLTAQNFDHGYG